MKNNARLDVDEINLLKTLMEENNWDVDQLADALGDSPLRIYRVLDSEESLGRTAKLAAIAIYSGLSPL